MVTYPPQELSPLHDDVKIAQLAER